MWIVFKTENRLSSARRWKALVEAEGIPARILPPVGPEEGRYQVLAPADKAHLLSDQTAGQPPVPGTELNANQPVSAKTALSKKSMRSR